MSRVIRTSERYRIAGTTIVGLVHPRLEETSPTASTIPRGEAQNLALRTSTEVSIGIRCQTRWQDRVFRLRSQQTPLLNQKAAPERFPSAGSPLARCE